MVNGIFKLGDPRSACIYPSYVSESPVHRENEIYFLSASAAVADIAIAMARLASYARSCSRTNSALCSRNGVNRKSRL